MVNWYFPLEKYFQSSLISFFSEEELAVTMWVWENQCLFAMKVHKQGDVDRETWTKVLKESSWFIINMPDLI